MRFISDNGKEFATYEECDKYEKEQRCEEQKRILEQRKKENELANEFAKIENALYVVKEMAKDFENKSGEHVYFYTNETDDICVKRGNKIYTPSYNGSLSNFIEEFFGGRR